MVFFNRSKKKTKHGTETSVMRMRCEREGKVKGRGKESALDNVSIMAREWLGNDSAMSGERTEKNRKRKIKT